MHISTTTGQNAKSFLSMRAMERWVTFKFEAAAVIDFATLTLQGTENPLYDYDKIFFMQKMEYVWYLLPSHEGNSNEKVPQVILLKLESYLLIVGF